MKNKRMPKKLWIGILIVVVAGALTAALFLWDFPGRPPKTMPDKLLVQRAEQLIDTRDFEGICTVYSELLENRDGDALIKKYNEKTEDGAPLGTADYTAVYLNALLCSKKTDTFATVYHNYIAQADTQAYSGLLRTLFEKLQKSTAQEDALYLSVLEIFNTREDLYPEDDEKALHYIAFLYFCNAGVGNHGNCEQLYQKLLINAQTLQKNASDFFEGERLNYTIALLNTETETRFCNAFAESFQQGQPFTGNDLFFLESAVPLSDAQQMILRQALTTWISHTDAENTALKNVLSLLVETLDEAVA